MNAHAMLFSAIEWQVREFTAPLKKEYIHNKIKIIKKGYLRRCSAGLPTVPLIRFLRGVSVAIATRE